MRILFTLLLLTGICYADEPSIVNCVFDNDCVADQYPNFKLKVIGTYSWGIVNPPPKSWITIKGKNEQIDIFCKDKNFNMNKEQCSDIRIVRHGLIMEK